MPTPAVQNPEPTPTATEEPDPDASDDPVQGPSGPSRTSSPHTATATPKPTVERGMAFTLTILGKNISVAGNVEASTLDKAPGWLPTSAKPGKEGVCVVYGHRNRNHLLVLKDIDYGDTILVTMPNGKNYTYAMNGHTGKVYGELPISMAKLGLLLAAVAVPLTALFTVIGGALF